MRTFLLIFDRRTSTVEVTPIEESDSIAARLHEAEARLIKEPNLEVVLLTAADEDDLRKTHARYFETIDELLEPA
jgi:hypothetical protein